MPIGLEIDAGDLRHRVVIYRRTITKNEATGADEVQYTEVFAIKPARMNPEGGLKFYGSDRFNEEDLETCMMRYRPGIDASMRLRHRGDWFEILSVDDVLREHVKLMLALRRLS